MSEPSTVTQTLHHAACLYAPGERALARAFFEVLGCQVIDSDSPFLLARVTTGPTGARDTWMFASEATPDQWALERALAEATAEGALADAAARYRARLRSDPQHGCHVAIRYATMDDLDAAVDRVEHLDVHKPALDGRVSLSAVFRPGDAGAVSRTQTQAFVYTDVIASGLLTFGQHVELQWEPA